MKTKHYNMKTMYRVAFMVVAIVLLVASVPVRTFATETDDRIESSSKDSYVFKKLLKDDAIQIESKGGVVVLTGTVAEESHKSLAQETVANVPGVTSVDNQLELKGEPYIENSDMWITTKVKSTLLFNRNVSVMTKVDTKDGIVTLEGEADSQAQKDLTTEYAKDIDGVKDVQNKMTVTGTPKAPGKKTIGDKVSDKVSDMGESIDDASITALVKMTLLYHRSTSGLQTRVETNKGMVTLAGTAKNAAERDLATKYAQDVHGVNSVVNNMTVGEPKAN